MLREHIARKYCSHSVLRVACPFLRKILLRGQNFVPQQAWNSADLNSGVIKQGQNDLYFSMPHCVHCSCKMSSLQHRKKSQCLPRVHQLAYCPRNMRPIRTRRGVWTPPPPASRPPPLPTFPRACNEREILCSGHNHDIDFGEQQVSKFIELNKHGRHYIHTYTVGGSN